MKNLFNRLYIITQFELITLIFFLLWKPSEDASHFFLGRSVYRWGLAFPAIVFLLAGTFFYFFYIRNEQFALNLREWGLDIFKKNKGSYLLIINILFITVLGAISWLIFEYRLFGLFIHILPWLVFIGVVLWQYSYWMILSAWSNGEDINLKGSFFEIPSVVRNFVFEKQTPSIKDNNLNFEKLYWFIVLVLTLVFLFVGYFFVIFAGLNSDEGWYLYAARQVYLGQRPYQDFAFTQMPVLPYIYGIGLSVFPSIYTGRLVSLVISCLNLFIAFLISKKYFNKEAFVWFFFVVISNSDSFYFNTIVKTYPLTLLLFLLSLYLWISNLKPETKYPLMFSVLLFGVFTRLTFAFFAFFILLNLIVEIYKLKNRSAVLAKILYLNVPLLFIGVSFLYPTPENFIWNVYTYNAGIHGFLFSANTFFEYRSHLLGYLRSVKVFWPIGIPIVFAVVSGYYYRNIKQEKFRLIFSVAFSVFLFLSVHFVGSGPMYEYYIPATTFLVALIIWFLFSFTEIKSGINSFVLWTSRFALVATTIMLIYTGRFGLYNYEYYHGKPPIGTIREIAMVVNRYYPEQPIFTMEALYVAIEARREIMPGMSMAQFSVLDLDREQAEELHFINSEMLIDVLNSNRTKVLVLNEREANSLAEIIENDYVKVFEVDNFGQKSIRAFVFIRK
ncbi:MAG: hypothetical protein JNM55_19305 [Anaerolineales bacterium]|nr:hypothetical protein [Anaerolineales bacterium]